MESTLGKQFLVVGQFESTNLTISSSTTNDPKPRPRLLVFHADSLAASSKDLVLQVSSLKMNAGAKELFVRGILCNWLVCLAVWLAVKIKSESAKLVMIFWCLFAFISNGFEHCVANMTLLSLGLLIPHGTDVSFTGMLHNLSWVTLGNIVGGALFVGMAYWFATVKKVQEQRSPVVSARESKAISGVIED